MTRNTLWILMTIASVAVAACNTQAPTAPHDVQDLNSVPETLKRRLLSEGITEGWGVHPCPGPPKDDEPMRYPDLSKAKFHSVKVDRVPPLPAQATDHMAAQAGRRHTLAAGDSVRYGMWSTNWADTSSSYPATGIYAKLRINPGQQNSTGGSLYSPTMCPAKHPGFEAITWLVPSTPINIGVHCWSDSNGHWTHTGWETISITAHNNNTFEYGDWFANNYTWVDTSVSPSVRYYWAAVKRLAGSSTTNYIIWNTSTASFENFATVDGDGTQESQFGLYDGWNMSEHIDPNSCPSFSGSNTQNCQDIQIWGRRYDNGSTSWYNANITPDSNPSHILPGSGSDLAIITSPFSSCHTKSRTQWTNWTVTN